MMRKALQTIFLQNRNGYLSNQIRSCSKVTSGKKEKWDLYAGVLIERLPIISKDLTPIEQEFQTLLTQIEFEQSLKSDHEVKHEQDVLIADLQRKGDLDVDLDAVTQQTAQDFKDVWKEDFKRFKFAPKVTPDDKQSNLRSTNRRLDETLYLLIEQQLGNDKHMILPQGKWESNETMRETAERVLRERCGLTISVQWYGNAPCGFYKYKYPVQERRETVGAKIFFYRSEFKSGNVDETIGKKFEWLDKEGLNGKLRDSYARSVNQFLF